jgi:hypothetical protein
MDLSFMKKTLECESCFTFTISLSGASQSLEKVKEFSEIPCPSENQSFRP